MVALSVNASLAGGVATSKAARTQKQIYALQRDGNMAQRAKVAAADAPRRFAALWTACRASFRCQNDLN
jgi:hypothetical protein